MAPDSWRYTSTSPADNGSLDIVAAPARALAGTWTSAVTGEVRSGWGLPAGDGRVIFGRSASGFAGVVVYDLVGGKLEALWSQTNVGGAIGTGTATRVGIDTGGFDGNWTIVYVNPDGTKNPPYGLEIRGQGLTRSLTWIGEPAFHGVGFMLGGRLCVGWGLTTDADVQAVLYAADGSMMKGPTASTASAEVGVEEAGA